MTAWLRASIFDWNVNRRSYNGSDHNSIEYKLCADKILVEPQWIWAKADWNLYADEIVKNLVTTKKFVCECDNTTNRIYNRITKALAIAVPKSKPKILD